MAIEKINPVYGPVEKHDGDALPASEWNELTGEVTKAQEKINEVIDGTSSTLVVQQDPQDAKKQIVNIGSILVGELTDKGAKGTNVTVAGNNNINVEPRPAQGTGGGSSDFSDVNRKGGNIALKPGDDIELYAHKRGTSKNTEVSVKVLDGEENPVKLQLNVADITLTVKDKAATRKKDSNGLDIVTPDIDPSTGKDRNALYDDPDVLNINVNKSIEPGTGYKKGYLKVRAQAIDLRSETHGGIALQPRGHDKDNHENKIKFEHGGGDGLEFGTFNTEKTSIYTPEYRFKKDGKVLLATRTLLDNTPGQGGNDKYTGDNVESTTHYSYKKNLTDDFYDNIDPNDPTCTWEDIINVASTLNGTKYTRTHITDGGNVEIESKNTTVVIKEFKAAKAATTELPLPEVTLANVDINTWYADTVEGVTGASRIIVEDAPKIQLESSNEVSLVAMNACIWVDADVTAENFASHLERNAFGTGLKKDTDPETKYADGLIYGITNDDRSKGDINMTIFDSNLRYVTCKQVGEAKGIRIESDANIKIASPKLTLEGVTGFGSSMSFGEADEGIKYQYKATKKGKNKQCDVLQVEVFNNGTAPVTFNEATHLASNSNKFTDVDGNPVSANSAIPTFYKTGPVEVPAGETKIVAQCSIMDIIKLVNYMKSNQQGPWQSA